MNTKTKVLLLHGVSGCQDALRKPYDFISFDQLGFILELIQSQSAGGSEIEISFDDGHESIVEAVDFIRKINKGIVIRLFIPTIRLGIYPPNGAITSEALRELALDKRVLIGAHGHSHTELTKLDRSSLNEEIKSSKSILEGLLDTTVTSISYPFGEVNSRVWKAALSAGFTRGYSSFWGINSVKVNPMRQCRVQILGSDTQAKIARKLTADFYLRGLFQRLRYSKRLL